MHLLVLLACSGSDTDPEAALEPLTGLRAELASVDADMALSTSTLDRVRRDGDRLVSAQATIGADRVRVRVTEGVDAEAAAALVADEVLLVQRLFDDRQAPYPGQLSNTLQCDERFRPVERQVEGALSTLTLYANDRLAYGGCSEDLLTYRASLAFFHAPETERLFKIEVFAADPLDDPGLELLDSFVAQGAGGAPVVRDAVSDEVTWSRAVAADADADPTCVDCNLLLVSLDIFRPDHMDCLGHDRDTAPNICAMAEEGTLFEDFVVHAYQTPIAQMSLFTGRYPSSSGFTSFTSVLDDDIPYLPERLKAAGYTTVAMGSSFEVMTDMSTAATGKRPKFHRDDLNPGLSFGRGFDRFVFTGNRNVPTDAIPWIEEHGDEKFFLWLILGSLHWPYGQQGDPTLRDMFDPPDYAGAFALDDTLSFSVLSRIYDGKLHKLDQGEVTQLTEDDLAFINARYDFGLWHVDRFVGELMAAMPPEVAEKTLVVLHGVHGEDLGEHGYFGHYDIFDTEVAMSAVVLDPQHAAKGVRVTEQVEGVDLAPTLLDLLGLEPMEGTDGQSFAQALADGKGDPDRLAFFERIPLWEDIFRHRTQMPKGYVEGVNAVLDGIRPRDTGVRTSRWKLLHRSARDIEAQVSWWGFLSGTPPERAEWELYDLQADPDEQVNVADQHPEVVEELKAELLAWEARYPGP